jgi:hypothetical protein
LSDSYKSSFLSDIARNGAGGGGYHNNSYSYQRHLPRSLVGMLGTSKVTYKRISGIIAALFPSVKTTILIIPSAVETSSSPVLEVNQELYSNSRRDVYANGIPYDTLSRGMREKTRKKRLIDQNDISTGKKADGRQINTMPSGVSRASSEGRPFSIANSPDVSRTTILPQRMNTHITTMKSSKILEQKEALPASAEKKHKSLIENKRAGQINANTSSIQDIASPKNKDNLATTSAPKQRVFSRDRLQKRSIVPSIQDTLHSNRIAESDEEKIRESNKQSHIEGMMSATRRSKEEGIDTTTPTIKKETIESPPPTNDIIPTIVPNQKEFANNDLDETRFLPPPSPATKDERELILKIGRIDVHVEPPTPTKTPSRTIRRNIALSSGVTDSFFWKSYYWRLKFT